MDSLGTRFDNIIGPIHMLFIYIYKIRDLALLITNTRTQPDIVPCIIINTPASKTEKWLSYHFYNEIDLLVMCHKYTYTNSVSHTNLPT